MSTCSIKLKKDKLFKIVNKLDFFMFRAMEQRGVSFYKISQNAKTAESIDVLNKIRNKEITKEQLQDVIGRKNAQVLITASLIDDQNKIGNEVYKIAQLLNILSTVKDSIIPSYINDYAENAAITEKNGKKEESENWKAYAGNLQSILTFWDQAVPNFFVFSKTFSLATKFKFDEDGLIDLNDVADDEQKMVNKMVFDKPSNETDVLDDVSKAVELFIRSISNPDIIDDFGFTSLIDYPLFMRQLFSDVENSIGMTELLTKLNNNKEKVPGYKVLLEKLTPSEGLSADEFKFRLEFRNSFVKAFMPILITSIEEGPAASYPGAYRNHAFKITEAASGKVTRYENNIQTNFTTYGMPVVMPNGEKVNLAHLLDGAWVLSKEDIPKISAYLDKATIEAKVNFLKAVGFEFSPETEKMLLTTDYLTNTKQSRFHFLQNHLIKALTYSKKDYTLNPYRTLVNDAGKDDKGKKIEGQQAMLSALIVEELKNNPSYNIEKSVITAEGTQMHSIQLHNNFTVLNKYLSDPEAFKTLQDIIDNEPSMFWLDPRKNPSIKRSLMLNSLFYFDPSNEKTFGKRRRVTADGNYSLTEGEYVQLTILNTGGVQLKLDGNFDKDGSSSTSLNEIDKLLQDMHGFFTTKNSNSSVLRLGDKGTDLGMGLNYTLDVVTGKPVKNGKPLGNIDPNMDVIRTNVFMDNVKNALADVAEMKYLGKKGFFKTEEEDGYINNGLTASSKNIEKTWSYFENILTKPTKDLLDAFIAERATNAEGNINDIEKALVTYKKEIETDVQDYFDKTVGSFVKKFDDVFNLGIRPQELLGGKVSNFPAYVRFYLANTFINDLEQMKIFFGDAIYFKDFHKRSSKDSATGVFTFVDKSIIEHLNDFDNSQGMGANTNLSARRFIDRLYEQKKITKNQRDTALNKQKLDFGFKSAVIKEVMFNSEQGTEIKNNIKALQQAGYISPEMEDLFNSNLEKTIRDGYKNAKEADGQGKCTFDFYRTMSILTSQWSDQQDNVYKKIVEYNHYDELADEEIDEAKKSEYIRLRDAVGYDPTEAVYFPPKKFQYSGPMEYSRIIDGVQYKTAPPVFDKFSLQPLIPTVIKKGSLKTTDWHLNRKMEFNGVGYVKFESATKVETPEIKDQLYTGYDENKPNDRNVITFKPEDSFVSQQQLFFNHLKEQVLIDAEIHESTTFGSQVRKLILMNLDRPEFEGMKNNYIKFLGQLAELEKNSLYNDMGIVKENGKLKIKDLARVVDYFFKEIAKKNQDSNVKKALNYDEATGKFDIPLDAAVQAQVLEGIIISAINNRVVRYKTNGSMLTQMAETGSEMVKFSKEDSARALEAYNNKNLKYYDVVIGENGKPTVTKMEVKIALTGQWLKLLELNHTDGKKIESLDRLNEMLNDEQWLKENEKAVTMIAYRIPTGGRNFIDVMKIKEFMPASVGDAIVMPRECIIKSGSDYDIDKMFTFYPNLDKNGKYVSFPYNDSMINENLESKKDGIVGDLNYLKLARRTTVNDLNLEFKDLEREYRKALRKDTTARDKLNRLLRRVETIIAVMDAEAQSNMKTSLTRFADHNSTDDGELLNLIRSNASYNVAEHEQWMKDSGENIFNPMLWIDSKKQGLETLKDSIENLFNSDVEYLKLTRDQNKEYIENLNDTLQTEINHMYDQLYAYNHIKQNIQNKLYETMSDIVLHPSNYMELVTPSENYDILPIIDAIYKKLNPKDKERKKTDYKNTEILEREKNIKKFISLLRGKSDLGIAAVANTFNVMYQLAKAQANGDFFSTGKYSKTSIKTFFDSENIEKSNGTIVGIDFSTIFDEDGALKSEFFTEFINAFVDVAKDDYVFAANVVTELSPILFYMKYAGMSSKKILNFANQPAIRMYTKNLSKYQNMFVKLNGVLVDENNKKISPRAKALNETLRQLNYEEIPVYNQKGDLVKDINKRQRIENYIIDKQAILKGDGLSKFYTPEALENQITPDEDFSKLSDKEKFVQVSMLLELENLREQSDSVTAAQKFLNFDTNPFASTFDVASRNTSYEKAVEGDSIFSKETLENIKKKSLISSLDVSTDITDILEQLFPVRNDKAFNQFLIKKTQEARSNFRNTAISSQDDEMKMARTAKNDFISFVLQNFIGTSEEGMKFFHETFDTTQNFNEYMLELIKTNKLVDMYKTIKDMTYTTKEGDVETVENLFSKLAETFPFVKNIQLQRGEYNHKITTWRIAETGSNVIEKESTINQFEELCNLPDEENKPIRDFFRNLALYSTFQSGLNTSENSFTSITPIDIINKLYGFAVDRFSPLSAVSKEKSYTKFYEMFVANNPSFYSLDSKQTITEEISSRGKWYSVNNEMLWERKEPVLENYAETADDLDEEGFLKTTNKVAGRFKGKMTSGYGGNKRADIKAISTFDAILDGQRTATTRYESDNSIDYWKKVKVGDIITWTGADGRTLDVIVTKALAPLKGSGKTAESWSKLEGWSVEYFNNKVRPRINEAWQIEFKLAQPTSSSINPLVAAGIKPTDMYGNAAKDIQMASESTQFIGFGTVVKEGNVSSTNKYAAAWGDKANTGNYTANDIIMVSGSGNFGRGGVDKTEEANAIKKTLTEKYKPLLEKAIAVGASFRIGNQYAKGNLSDELVAKYLQQKGYTENKMDGYSKWTAPPSTPVVKSITEEKKMPKKPFERTFTPPTRDAQGNVVARNEVIDKFRNELFKPAWTSMTDAEILEKYEKEHISGETLKEFLDRISC